MILFGMYLYEYGHKCPQPNNRRVYVSYLDSVYYFRPRENRTLVYHEMLIAYLAHAKERGFHTAHIWACPPCKGDDYIFFCHPEDQKTPKDDRLRLWYITLLRKARDEGVVTRITNLWDENFKSDFNITQIPYFEGDYWPGEAENVAKAISDEANERLESKSKKKAKARAQRGLRSDGSVEEELGTDSLIVRMGKILEPMKDAFIVAYLQPRIFACAMGIRHKKELNNSNQHGAEIQRAPSNLRVGQTKPNSPGVDKTSQSAAKANINDPEARDQRINRERHFDETEDKDETIESEFYDTRQQFLNLCQGNHYQFDDLRRAKHTSMMSLYHTHNPDVPKFLVTCSNCNIDINSGCCYTSEQDTDFHLCQVRTLFFRSKANPEPAGVL